MIARSDGRVIDRAHTLSVQIAEGSRRFEEVRGSGVVDEGELGGLGLLDLEFLGGV